MQTSGSLLTLHCLLLAAGVWCSHHEQHHVPGTVPISGACEEIEVDVHKRSPGDSGCAPLPTLQCSAFTLTLRSSAASLHISNKRGSGAQVQLILPAVLYSASMPALSLSILQFFILTQLGDRDGLTRIFEKAAELTFHAWAVRHK